MELEEAFRAFDNYDLWLGILGIAILATAILPRFLSDVPITMPMVLLTLGFLVVWIFPDLKGPDPMEHLDYAEHLTEIGVIVALMGAGIKIDRPFNFKKWTVTWRLLGITMILSIAMAALVGWYVAAFVPATAMLLGAVIAPTDPVLASEVQVGSPGEGSEDEETEDTDTTGHREEDEMRFALTSEAGLNDGLAFPFTNMAIAMAIAGAYPGNWIESWLLMDVLYKLIVAGIIGISLGFALAWFIMLLPAKTQLAKAMVGIGALAATLIIYGITEYVGAYGFIATFIGAVCIRNYKRRHEYHDEMHKLNEKIERLLTAIILIALGAAIAGGLLAPLDWKLILAAVLIIFLVRPLAGIIGLIGFNKAPWRERLFISFFGIRGIGSLYYLSFALNEENFEGAEQLWALVGLVIVISIFVHGVTGTPISEKLDEMREKEA